MREQGSPFSPSLEETILVAAEPQDEQAIALVQTLRNAGLRVIFAETSALATWAGRATASVMLLRPDTWNTQTIAAVMRTKPTCLIPVLAEPMELPHGPWTHEAIGLSDKPDQTAQEILQVLQTYLASHPAPLQPINSTNTPLKFKARRRPSPLFTTLLILLIVGLGGALGYHYIAHPATGQSITPNLNIPTTVTRLTYSTKTPGPNCDTGDGQWTQANHYVKDKKTEIIDQYTTLQCQSNGSLLTRSGNYRFYGTIFFEGLGETLPLTQHYNAQVDATIISGDPQADLMMEVHTDNGYGRYRFDVNTFGHWEANTTSTVDGSPLHRLAIGFLPKASKTYTLAVEVNGPVMTFSINGTKVTAVTDTTYTDNRAITFGVNDYTATQPISALFSNFQYKELSPSTLATPQVLATATAQAQTSAQAAYTAHLPGYGCDQGAGQWQPLADDQSSGTLNCLANGMQLINPAHATQITAEHFYWLNGHFPQNYQISTNIDVSAAQEGCAGIETRENDNGQAYFFVVCPDGSWQMAVYTDKFHTLAQGTVRAHGSYQIVVIDQGAAQSLSIDGSKVSTVNDTQEKVTDHISLLAGYYSANVSTSATFSNFIFTPLP